MPAGSSAGQNESTPSNKLDYHIYHSHLKIPASNIFIGRLHYNRLYSAILDISDGTKTQASQSGST
jgi:hypothetical protein